MSLTFGYPACGVANTIFAEHQLKPPTRRLTMTLPRRFSCLLKRLGLNPLWYHLAIVGTFVVIAAVQLFLRAAG